MNPDQLLDIKEAAALLKVSEASLRRWTNSGKLAAFRVGGRRERRFRYQDLIAFLEEHPEAAEEKDGKISLPHNCGFYTSDLSRTRLAASWLSEGLKRNNLCVLKAAPDVRQRVSALIQQNRPELPSEIAAGRLVLAEYTSLAADIIASWKHWLDRAAAENEVLCIVGDVSGSPLAQSTSIPEVLEYENMYSSMATRFQVRTLCLYDARTLSGADMVHLLRCHPDTLRYPVETLLS